MIYQEPKGPWLNAAQCLRCFDVIESTHRYDFRSCSCGALSVDGGPDYGKRCYTPGVEYIELSSGPEDDA